VVYQPLWKIWVRQLGWWNSQLKSTEWKNEIHVPNHQPVSGPYPCLKGMETKPRHGCHALISRSRAISWVKETPWMERPRVARKKGGRNLTMTSVPYANICQYMPNFWLARPTLKLTKQHQLADVRNKTRPPPLPTTSWSPPFFNWHSQVSSSCQGAGYVSTSCWFPFPKSSAVALAWDVPEVDLLWPRSPQWEVGLRWPLILTNDVSASTCAMPQTLLGLSGTSYFWWPLQYLWPFTMLRWLNFMALTRLREGRDCWPLGFGWTPFAVFNTFYINKKTTKTQGKTLNEPLKKNLSEP
jgi:hypothetical protein